MRSQRSLKDIARCYARLFSKQSGITYSIPASPNQGLCTWSFCTWWARISFPYLSQSLYKVQVTLTKDKTPLREDVYVITDMRGIVDGLRGSVKLFEVPQHSAESTVGESCDTPQPSDNLPTSHLSRKRVAEDDSSSIDVNFKLTRRLEDLERMASMETSTDAEWPTGPILGFDNDTREIATTSPMVSPGDETSMVLYNAPPLEPAPIPLSQCMPQHILNSLQSLLPVKMSKLARRSIIDGVKTIADALLGFKTSQDPQLDRLGILEDLVA